MPTRYRDAVTTEPVPAGEQRWPRWPNSPPIAMGTPPRRALRDGEWQQLTYNELWDRVRDLALGFARLGVGVGDRVAILANTCVEFTIADLAASTAGAVVVPVYPSNSPEECEWVVGDSGSKVIVCEDADQAKIARTRTSRPWSMSSSSTARSTGVPTMEQVEATGREDDPAELDTRPGRSPPTTLA